MLRVVICILSQFSLCGWRVVCQSCSEKNHAEMRWMSVWDVGFWHIINETNTWGLWWNSWKVEGNWAFSRHLCHVQSAREAAKNPKPWMLCGRHGISMALPHHPTRAHWDFQPLQCLGSHLSPVVINKDIWLPPVGLLCGIKAELQPFEVNGNPKIGQNSAWTCKS